MNNEKSFLTSDKIYCPYLLAMVFNDHLDFIGVHKDGSKVTFEFTPAQKAKDLINSMEMKCEPQIPIKDVFSAIEYFWKQVAGD